MHLSGPPEPTADPADIVRATRDWYDTQSESYAARTTTYSAYPGLEDEIGLFADAIATTAGAPVLDLGCGAGRDSRYLSMRGRTVVAADLSGALLRLTRRLCAPMTPGCVQVDMRRLPFADHTFCGVWACASVVHVPEPDIDATIAELCRVLLPGGRVAISMRPGTKSGWGTSEMSPGLRWFTVIDATSFAALLTAHGFVDVQIAPGRRRDWYVARACAP